MNNSHHKDTPSSCSVTHTQIHTHRYTHTDTHTQIHTHRYTHTQNPDNEV